MKVQVVAYTVIAVPSALESTGYRLREEFVNSADELAEFADRHYLGAFGKTPDGTNEELLCDAIEDGSTGIFDHASATLIASGVSRRLGVELDARFHAQGLRVYMPKLRLDEDTIHFVVPDLISKHDGLTAYVEDLWEGSSVRAYQHLMERLVAKGHSPKEAAQAAECVLPAMVETTLLASGTMSTWRDVAVLSRRSGTATPEAVNFATKALVQLKTIAPNTFQAL